MPDSIIRMEHLSYAYEDDVILEDINLDIRRGQFIGLIGPNGGGKTTLIRLMLGLLPKQKGEIFLLNQPIDSFKEWNKIGFVSQKANSFNKGFPATVLEVVSMGLTAKLGYFHFLRKKHREKIVDALRLVHMEAYIDANIGDLSGGQQQRVFIARALVSDPELLILDEPTVGVDYQNVEHFYDILHQLNKERQMTLLLVTHDTGVMTQYATSIACLNKTLHFHGSDKEYTALSADRLSEIYGHPVQVVVHDHD